MPPLPLLGDAPAIRTGHVTKSMQSNRMYLRIMYLPNFRVNKTQYIKQENNINGFILLQIYSNNILLIVIYPILLPINTQPKESKYI